MRICMWTGLSCGVLSGGLAGGLEAIFTLAGVDVGEYDAIFWGVAVYSLTGIVIGAMLGTLLWLLKRWVDSRKPLVWSVSFSTLAIGQLLWAFDSIQVSSLMMTLPIWCFSIWIMTIFLMRTPLKVLPTPRGTLVMWAFCIILSGVFSLTPGQNTHSASNKMETSGSNVLMIMVDGLRSDHIGVGRTNAIDAFVQESVFFTQATTNSPSPLHAAAAIMGRNTDEGETIRLSKSDSNLAQKLSRAGYHTAAFVNHLDLGRHSNFHHGFDTFHYLPPRSPLPLTEGARRLRMIQILLDRWGRNGFEAERHYRKADEIVFGVRKFIEQKQQEPWFIVAHFRETSAPFHGQSNRPIWPNMANPNTTAQAYRQELLRMDEPIGRLLNWLSDQSFTDNTFIVLLSTRGADFERAQNGPSPYQSQVHVPIAIKGPGLQPRRIAQRMQLSDLPRTLSALISIEPEQDWRGNDALKPAESVLERPSRPVRSTFSDKDRYWQTVQLGGWKLVLGDSPDGPINELYNLLNDPNERDNQYDRNPVQRERLMMIIDR